MAQGKHRHYMELVAYHIYHLEFKEHTQVISKMVKPSKNNCFAKICRDDTFSKIVKYLQNRINKLILLTVLLLLLLLLCYYYYNTENTERNDV